MKGIKDAETIFINSGLFEMDHYKNKFNKKEFIDFFWRNYSGEEECQTAFIDYIAKENNCSRSEVIYDYGLTE